MAVDNFAVFDDSNFDAQVLVRDGLTVVDFWSTTCVPCKQLKKVLGQVAEDVPENVVIGTVNGDENPIFWRAMACGVSRPCCLSRTVKW